MLAWRGLAHRYPSGTELRFADFELGVGQHLLVQGSSGSGKSTLLALIAGLLRVQCGEVIVSGTRLRDMPPSALDAWRGQMLGVVPQRLHLSPALTVRDNLLLPGFATGVAVSQARVEEVLAALGLTDMMLRRPHELSVGQAQRVAIARALVRRPPLLLADEPSASLDDDHAQELLTLLLQTAQRESCTLVVASHDSRLTQPLQRRADVTAWRLTP